MRAHKPAVATVITCGVCLLTVAPAQSSAPARASRSVPPPAAGRHALGPTATATSAAAHPGFWGGVYGVGRVGVHIYSSNAYPKNARNRRANRFWAKFFAHLLHGPEIRSVKVFFVPNVARYCASADAGGCYDVRSQSIFLVDDEVVAAHEYGHHIAASRNNAPWRAYAWGPKYWASSENVCAATAAGREFPGNERRRYADNPGEGWAEAYAELMVPHRWDSSSFSPIFRPDRATRAAIRRDVLHPWRGPRPHSFSGSVPAHTKWRVRTLGTPLDGWLRVTLRAARGGALAVELIDPRRRLLLATSHVGSRTSTRALVCGERRIELAVAYVRGPRRFKVSYELP